MPLYPSFLRLSGIRLAKETLINNQDKIYAYMNPYIELMRPVNGLMTVIAVIIGGLLVGDVPIVGSTELYVAILSAFLILSAGNALNDYYDVGADSVNRPRRPIPSGRISRQRALHYSVLLFLAGILLSGFLPWLALMMAIVNTGVIIVYDYSLKHKAYIGNIAVSYLVGSIYLFGSAAFWNHGSSSEAFFTLPLILFSMSALANFSREVVKDLEDIEGDMASFAVSRLSKAKRSVGERFGMSAKGVAVKAKRRTAVVTAFISIIVAVLISFLPYAWGIFGIEYLAVVIISDAAFVITAILILKSRAKKDYSRASRRIKVSMLIGLLAFIVGAVSR